MAATKIKVPQLANGTDGELITWDASGVPATVAVGTSGHVLTSNGVGTAPTFQAAVAADGNGIYTGSGNIGLGVVSSSTRAKIPDEGTFRIDYFDTAFALQITDTEADAVDITLKSNDGTVLMEFDGGSSAVAWTLPSSTGLFDIYGSGTLIRNNGSAGISAGSIDSKAILELSSTTKGLLLPRLDATQFTALGATTDGMVIYNTATDTIKLRANSAWVDLLDTNSIATASNGLTKTVNNIKLGGTLVDATTTITGDTTNYLIVTGARTGAGNASLQVNNTGASGPALKTLASGSGAGIWGESTSGTGAYGSSATGIAVGGYTGGNNAALFQVEPASTNTVLNVMILDRLVAGGVGADGIGQKILFRTETSTSTREVNSIVSKWTAATDASRISELSFTGYNIGVENTLLTFSGTGAARLNKYGVNTFTGTAAYALQVDSSGNVIEGALSGSSSVVITPSQLTADQNDYAPTNIGTATVIRLDSDSSMRAITGITSGTAERTITLRNVGSNPISIPSEHTGSTAANRFRHKYRVYLLYPGEQTTITYDDTLDRWILVGQESDYYKNISYVIPVGSDTAAEHPYIVSAATTGSVTATAATSTIPGHWLLSHIGGGGVSASAGLMDDMGVFTSLGGCNIRSSAMVSIGTLSDGTDTFTTQFRISPNATTATATLNDTIGIRHSSAINSGKWELFTNNGGVETTADSGVTVVADALYHLEVCVNKARTAVLYYINGDFVGAITTNIPAAQGMALNVSNTRTAGGTTRSIRLHKIEITSTY